MITVNIFDENYLLMVLINTGLLIDQTGTYKTSIDKSGDIPQMVVKAK